MDTATCKIMLSSVVVEHCRLLGSKCAGETCLIETPQYYEGQYVSIRGGCTPLNPRIIKGRLP